MNPASKRRTNYHRLKTEPKKITKQSIEQSFRDPNSIVFQSQIKSLQNYFTFLENTFGNPEIAKIVKNIPHEKNIVKKCCKPTVRNSLISNYITQNVPTVQAKVNTLPSWQLSQSQLPSSHRNIIPSSMLQQPSVQLKYKFQNSIRKRHSFLMRKMSHATDKTHTTPITFKKTGTKDENEDFFPMGHSIAYQEQKDRRLMQPRCGHHKNTRKQRQKLLLLKNQTEVKPTRKQVHLDETSGEGPWRIEDSHDYNPRAYYSTYR